MHEPKEEEMTERHQPTTKARMVCGLTQSSAGDALLRAAIAHCREHDFELVAVWIVDPTAFQSPNAVAGGPGAWGLVGAWSDTLERARAEGLVAGTVFRFGEPTRILEEERQAFGAEMAFRPPTSRSDAARYAVGARTAARRTSARSRTSPRPGAVAV
jgi:hypothetical protein